ncbi:hypothetical protein [Streptomyces sp. NPDC059080]|uniref:hypothetical protein n=1 Tax=Streptomyces sp. NPDC059080 TaxID=3346718 RepID=UPI0036BB7401
MSAAGSGQPSRSEPRELLRTGYRRYEKGRGRRAAPRPCHIDAAARAAEQAADEQQRLARLMSTPPVPRETRARHTTGGQHR